MKCECCGRETQGLKLPFRASFVDFKSVEKVLCFTCENRLELIMRSFLDNPSKVWSLIENEDLERDIIIETSKKIAEDGYESDIKWVHLNSLEQEIFIMMGDAEKEFSSFNLGKEKALNELLDKLDESK